MIDRWVRQAGERWADAAGIVLGGRCASFGELAAMAASWAGRMPSARGARVGLALEPGPQWIAAAAALDRLGARTFLLSPGPQAETRRLAERFGLDAVLADAAAPPVFVPQPHSAESPAVVILTSGTSGAPKSVVHTWESLASGIKHSDKLAGARMLLTYDLARYAGLQVMLTALANGATLCIPPSRRMADLVETILRDRVEFVSATPTFWRMLLASSSDEQLGGMPLRQITLGGEAVGQPILDALRVAFPAARITHIYASTEMGVCFSVHDGREGFPAEFLQGDAAAVRLKIEDGRLWIRSARSMAGYLNGGDLLTPTTPDAWYDTGDAVHRRGDRIYFLGRESTRINVGGEKVYPEEIEAVIRAIDGVAEVRVSGRASSIVGQIVQAEIVPAPGADDEALRRRITESCRDRLADYKQPRVIEFVTNLAVADTLKIQRRNVQP